MSQLSRDQLGDAFNVLTDRVKEGMMAPLYQRMREGYEKELARDKAKEAMKRFKEEVASEIGVPLKEGYNGELTSRQAGSIGGEMVKKMIMKQEEQMSGR